MEEYKYHKIDLFLNSLLSQCKDKFNESVNEGIISDDSIILGYSYPIDIPNFLENFMDWWVTEVDCKIDTVKEWGEAYITLFSKRIFTLDEFRIVLKGRIKEENLREEKVFSYLYIEDKHALDLYISKLPEDEEITTLYRGAVKEHMRSENIDLYAFFFEKKMKLYFPISSLDKHAHILAKSGSGKSEIIKLLFYNLQIKSAEKWNKSLIALAPEADLPTELLRFNLNKGGNMKRVVFLDPDIRATAKFLLGEDIFKEDYIFHINPLHLNKKDANNAQAIDNHTQQLSKAFFEIFRDDVSLTPNMKGLVKGCINTLLRIKGTTVLDLKRFMDDEINMDLVNNGMKHPNKMIRTEMLRFQHNSRTNATKSSINAKLYDLLINETFAKILSGQQTIDIEEEINQGKVIICNFTKGKMGTDGAPAFGKLFVALVQAAAMKRENIPKAYRKKTYMFLDEFQNYVNPSIEELMAESRKFKLMAILSHQVWGQNMSSAVSKIVTGNTSLKVGGESDKDTRKHLISQFKGVKEKDFEELKKYHFFIYNTSNKSKGTVTLSVPDFLVKVKPPLYLDKLALKKYFLWLVEESGYYIKDGENENLRTKRSDFSEENRQNNSVDVYDPDFED